MCRGDCRDGENKVFSTVAAGYGLRADYQFVSGLNFGSLQDGDKFEDQGRFAPDADLAKYVAQMGTDCIICNV